jgi:hypothetical protein
MHNKFNPAIHHRKSIRLKNYDYSQKHSEDGDPYHSGADFDEQFFTVKVMDASGWESMPARTALFARPQPVKKGSAAKPTTAILTGTVLAQGNGPVRSYVVQAAAASILDAINDPTVGGYLDEACEMRALNAVVELHADPLNGSVELNWKTVGEVDSTGFNIYRAESENGDYTKINSDIVSAKGSPTMGAGYAFADKEVKNRKTYWYKLESIYLNGTSTMCGPVSAAPGWIHAIFGRQRR